MFLDQFSLLAAIGFSSAALCTTLFGAWFGSRRDLYLLNWSIGLAAIVCGVVLYGAIGDTYSVALQCASFVALILGFGLIYAGSVQFCRSDVRWPKVIAETLACATLTGVAFFSGLSGLGTAVANFGIAALLVLTAREYWIGRAELPAAMKATAALYVVTATSFLLCGLVLVSRTQFVLTARPANWAEDLNSIVVIAGLTGIGALSLMMNQSRIARVHRMAALTDPLTGLPNRRALIEQYEASPTMRTAAILFDLDHFKQINDRFGHSAGDVVLKRFSAILSANLRATDLAARVGGEEFCMIMLNVGRTEAIATAERIRRELVDLRILVAGDAVAATVSVGVAIAIEKAQLLDGLLREADAALYEAKASGRNRVCESTVRLVA